MRTISIGELRQNPTRMLREVRGGAVYVVTDRGEPVAEVVPRRAEPWVAASAVDELLRDLGEDAAWRRELDEDRIAVTSSDPWGDGE